jgi:hypothetical protein
MPWIGTSKDYIATCSCRKCNEIIIIQERIIIEYLTDLHLCVHDYRLYVNTHSQTLFLQLCMDIYINVNIIPNPLKR